jgi:hypothetical protein
MLKVALGGLALAALGATPLATLSDEFETSPLAGWNVTYGDDFGDGTDHGVAVRDGALTLTPRTSWWVDDREALYVAKPVTGDFVATMRVRVTGTESEEPRSNWTLSGILARDPRSTHARENWVSFRTGWVDGGWVYERKTTQGSRSRLVLWPSHDGWVDLRLARVGARFLLLRRDGSAWKLHWEYARPDFGKALQVGIDAFTGYDAPRGDMVARVDWIHFAPTGIPAGQRKAPAARLLRYLTR